MALPLIILIMDLSLLIVGHLISRLLSVISSLKGLELLQQLGILFLRFCSLRSHGGLSSADAWDHTAVPFPI